MRNGTRCSWRHIGEAFPNVVPPLFESSNSPAPSQTHSITTSDSRQTMELDTSIHMEVDSHLATFEAKVEVTGPGPRTKRELN